MNKFELGRRALLGAALAMGLGGQAMADGHQVVDSIHFLIPGGAGGGWDGTARGTGEALTGAGLVGTASYENMSGGGGGKAIGFLIENADSNQGTLMVNSTPIIIRSLTGVFPHNFRDLTLVAGTIGDYAAIVVGKDSELNSMADLLAAFDADPSGTAVGGGSVPGGMDHLVAAMVMEAAGKDALAVKYIPYDAGGKAMAALLSGEIAALSTGFKRALTMGMTYVVTLDADGQHNPDEIPRFAGRIAETGADIVVGNRFGALGEMPWLRRATNWLTSKVVSMLAQQRIPDSQNGYRMIGSNVISSIELETARYEAESEILIKAGRKGFRIESVPVETIYGEEVSAIHPVVDTARFFRLVYKALFW